MALKVYLDMDGVLCDVVTPISKRLGVEHPHVDLRNRGSYNFDNLLGPNWKEPIWNDEDFWANLPKHEEADYIVNRLKGQRVSILTSPIWDKGTLCHRCISGKALWIQNNYPDLLENLILSRNKHFYARVGALLIDDADDNISKFNESGGASILVPRLWNKLHGTETLPYLRGELDAYFKPEGNSGN